MQPIRSDHNVLPVYARGSYHPGDLLSSGDGGQPTEMRQAPDNHMIICQPFQKKEERKKKGNEGEQMEERQEATSTTYFS